MKPLRPFFSYFGAKWRIAKTYPAPLHETIVEPFAGSACYSLHHYDRQVLLVEKNPVVAGIWRYLIAATPAEIRRLPLLKEGQMVADLRVPQEARDLIGFWCARSATSPAKGPNAWMKKHAKGYPSSFWGERIRERIASQVDRIKHWQIAEGGYENRIFYSFGGATWFIDPPYQEAGKSYVYGPDLLDYEALGRWCQHLPGQVIVCENEGANWLPFEPHKEIWGTCKRSKEVVWIA